MSTDTTPQTSGETLTDEEQSVFERLADRFEDDDVGRICELVIQSSTDSESTIEEAKS